MPLTIGLETATVSTATTLDFNSLIKNSFFADEKPLGRNKARGSHKRQPAEKTLARRTKSLSEFYLFADLEPHELQVVEALARERTIDKGQLLFLPGDWSETVFFLSSGRIKISRLSESGKELIIEIMEPGSFFGETGVLDEKPRETMAEALEPSVLWVVPAASFRGLLHRAPNLLMKLTQLMGRRLGMLEKRLADVVFKNATHRLADLLLELGRNHGVRDSRGILLCIKLSQSCLGNLLGVSREIVNHALSRLRRRGVIDCVEGRIIICLPEALAELAG